MTKAAEKYSAFGWIPKLNPNVEIFLNSYLSVIFAVLNLKLYFKIYSYTNVKPTQLQVQTVTHHIHIVEVEVGSISEKNILA